MNFSGNLIPIANSTYTLGNATYKIAYVHANQIRSYSTAYFASIYPDANNSYYLGSTTA